MRINRIVLRVVLLLGLLGFSGISAVASGPGTQPDPDGPTTASGPGH